MTVLLFHREIKISPHIMSDHKLGSKEGLRGLYKKLYFLEIWKELDFMRKYSKVTVISVKLKVSTSQNKFKKRSSSP